MFKSTREIKFEHFILKAAKIKILTIKPKCKNEIFKMHGIINLFDYLITLNKIGHQSSNHE